MSKKIVLTAVVLILALAASKMLSLLVVASLFNFRVAIWIWFFVLFALSYAIFYLITLSKDPMFIILNSLLLAAAFIVFLPHTLEMYILGTLLALANLTLFTFAQFLEQSLNLRYFSSVYHKSVWVAVVLLAFFSAFYASNINGSQQFVNNSVNYTWPYIKNTVPQFNTDQTVNQYLASQFSDQGIGQPSAAMLSAGQKEIGTQLGISVYGSEKMSDIGKQLIASKAQQLLNDTRIGDNSVFVVFLLLLILLPLARLLMAIFAVLVYELARSTKLIKVIETQITAKSLEI